MAFFIVVWEREGNQLAGGELERMCERIDIEDNRVSIGREVCKLGMAGLIDGNLERRGVLEKCVD